MKTFTISEALSFGWQQTRAHSGILLQAMLTIFGLQVVSSIVSQVLKGTVIGALASVALAVVGIVLGMGFLSIALKLARSEAVHYRDMFPWNRAVWYFFLASVLSGLAFAGGIILLIIPGIILIVRLSMARFAVIDGARPVEALKRSWAETRGHFWHMLGFLLVLLALNLVGAVVFLVGLLVSVPVTTLAWAHVYDKLKV